jgi:hypothetical protein
MKTANPLTAQLSIRRRRLGRNARRLALLAALVAVLPVGPVAAQAPNAVAGPNVILSPFNFWSDPRMGRFYNPAAIVVGSDFFLYVHGGAYSSANGGPGSDCATSNEQILIFKTPYTHDNIRSTAYGAPLYCASGCAHPAQGAWTYMGHANPCSPTVAHHYQLGSVFRSSWDNQYKLLVDETDNGTSWAAGNFKRTLLLTSADGVHWAPQANPGNGLTPPLLAQSTVGGQVVSVGEVSLVQGAAEQWGTFAFGASCDCVHGRIRIFQNAANPRGFVAYLWSTDNQWHAVNDDGTFNYMPAYFDGTMAINSINVVAHAGHFEAWGVPGYNFTPTQPLDPIDPGCNDGNGGKGIVMMATIAEGTADTVTPPPALGTPVYVTSSLDANPNHALDWPLATQDTFGRITPVRFDDAWGKYLLYSGSLDGVCWAGLLSGSTWRGMEVRLTVVDR